MSMPSATDVSASPLQLFEALPPHIEDALRASIERFGVLVPVAKDQHGRVLDGHHRARIADHVGVKYRIDVIQVADDDEAREIARTLNADRRQLTEEQRREVVTHLRSLGHSQTAIAEALGVSQSTVRDDLAEVSSDTKLPDRVTGKDGKSYPAKRPTIVSAKDEDEAAKAQEALTLLGDKAPEGGRLIPREAVKLAARERAPDPVREPVAVPDGMHHTLVLDPPWPMKKIERDERPNQGVELDYPTMPVWCQKPEIVSIRNVYEHEHETNEPVYEPCFRAWWDEEDGYGGYEPCQSIECVVGRVVNASVLDDAHIYLWVTHRFLPDGLELLKSWGFNYQCLLTWRKNVGITPFSWMYDTEHAIFGRRGSLDLLQLGVRLSFDAPVRGHSVKPDAFYDRVAVVSPAPRLEMFSRRQRDGFAAWGNEV